MGSDYTVAHAAVLAAQLPRESRCLARVNPDLSWSDETMALAHIEWLIRLLIWGLGGKKGPEPKPLQTPSEAAHMRERFENIEDLALEVARDLGIGD